MVDGLEDEYAERATVLRADIQTEAGRELARRYELATVPAFVVFAGDGDIVYRSVTARGVPEADLRRALARALSRPAVRSGP